MQQRSIVIAGGLSFIVGALAFVCVFGYLAANFDYPGILDGSAAEVLPRLRGGGSAMRAIWAIYALLPLLLVPAAVGTYFACPSSRGDCEAFMPSPGTPHGSGNATKGGDNRPMPKASAVLTPATPPRAVRDRGATEARILAAVGEVLARDGFGGVGVNAIAKQAGVDKVLIYRYFGGLPELLTTWGRSGQFWPRIDEVFGGDPVAFQALPPAERYARFIEYFIDGMRARPLTLEILAAEVVERNELTIILESEREAWGEQATRLLGGEEFAHRPELVGITNIVIAGVQHLLLRSRRIRIFGGIDIRSDAGWDALKASVRAMAQSLIR